MEYIADVTTGVTTDGETVAAKVTEDSDAGSLVTEVVAMVAQLVVVTIVMVATLVEAVSKSKENHALFHVANNCSHYFTNNQNY